MKWILILMLVACGHQEPDKMDLDDSDGDRLANAYEAKQTKFQADFRPLNKIEGILNIVDDKNASSLELAFTNFRDLNQEAFRKLTWREDKLPSHDYFSEFSRLIFKSSIPSHNFAMERMYTVKLKFESIEDLPGFVYLVTSHSRVKVASLEKSNHFQLKGHSLRAILNSEAHLDLARSEHETERLFDIKAKSYRIYRHDGNKTNIYYYSKDFPFSSYLAEQNLTNVKSLDYQSDKVLDPDTESWWSKELANGDKILVFSNVAKIKEQYLEGLQKDFRTLERVEGISQKAILLKGENYKNNQRVLLRISPGLQKNRTFHERRYPGKVPGSDTRTCTLLRRKITGEENHETTQEMLISNLVFKIDHEEIELTPFQINLETKFDDKGRLYWEFQLEFAGQELSINLKNQPNPDNIHGDIESNCPQFREHKLPVHTEMNFNLAVKAYLED